jgi:enoyl-[acyl-carrier protein] reductase II
MRVIRNRYVAEWEEHPQDIEPFPAQMQHTTAVGAMTLIDGPDTPIDPELHCMPAGQGVGGIRDIRSCREIVESVVEEARRTIERLSALR